MGRLDDHAKRRIVELRRAGLSFRKIKKVLELDGIRVTPQAVYLFLKRKSVEPVVAAASWDGEQPWPPLRGHEAEPPKPLGACPTAVPGRGPTGSRAPCPAGGQDTKEGIQIVSVASLCQGSGQLGEALPVGLGLPPGNGDDSCTGAPMALGSCSPSGGTAAPPQPLPSRGRLVAPSARNPALMVKKKMIMDRAILQKKVGCQPGWESLSAPARSRCSAARQGGPAASKPRSWGRLLRLKGSRNAPRPPLAALQLSLTLALGKLVCVPGPRGTQPALAAALDAGHDHASFCQRWPPTCSSQTPSLKLRFRTSSGVSSSHHEDGSDQVAWCRTTR